MSFFNNGLMFKKVTLILSTCLFSGILSAFTFPISTYAEDPAISGVPDFTTSVTSVLSHSHRGSSDQNGGCYTVPVYHTHSGDSTSGGACYSPHYHTHGSSCYSTCNYVPVGLNFINSESSWCSHHGDTEKVNYTVTLSHSSCGRGLEDTAVSITCTACGGHPYNNVPRSHQYLTCNRGGSIEYYTFSCTKTEGETIDRYDAGCGLDAKEYGSITLTNTTPGWTNGPVILQGTIDDPEGILCADGYGVLSFDAASGTISGSTSDTITVSENGVYTMNISVDDSKFDSAQASVMLNVSNIDTSYPVIESIDYDRSDSWLHESAVKVTAKDIQPDGSNGSGLHEEAYSFDGGITWQASDTYTFNQNGEYTVCVRDNCNNTVSETFTISNLDNEGPSVTYDYTPKTWYEGTGSRDYTFTATDDGAGLDENPYSYDNGETWTDDNTISKDTSGSFTVLVKDSMGNITELIIDNTYSIRPPAPESGDNDGDGSYNDPGDNPGNQNSIPTVNDPSNMLKEDPDVDSEENVIEKNDDTDTILSDTKDNTETDDTYLTVTYTDPDTHMADDETRTDTVYFEQIPTSNGSPGLLESPQTAKLTPFYKNRLFIATASVSGGLLGLSLMLLAFLLLYSGVIVYTYDGSKYRLTGIVPIRRSERGNYIHIGTDLMERAYSAKYKLKLGRIYVMRRKDDPLLIKADEEWYSVNTDRFVYTIIKNTEKA
ncbi:MAG: hypothetical protein K6G12_10380 [Lachnospiraceae bacterium]|nr:hypothetical protein [Lachnospiraceae bacterium]